MAADESFGAVAFNIDLGSGISQARGGWQADRAIYDVVGADGRSTWISPWSINQSMGASSSDLGSILLMMKEETARR